MNTALNRTVIAVKANKSGGTHVQGDVCIEDTGNANAVENDTSGAFKNGAIWVCLEPNGVVNDASGLYASMGYVPKLTLSAGASLGDLVKTHTVAKQGVRHAAPFVAGDFAMVLGTGSSPAAWLFGMPYQGASAQIMELIAEVTPSGVGTISIASSIVATFKKLVIEFAIRSTQSANNVDGYLQINGDTTTGNYRYQLWRSNPFGTGNDNGSSYIFAKTIIPGANATASFFAMGVIELIQYANTGFFKVANIRVGSYDNNFQQQSQGSMNWLDTSAIDEVVMALSAGNFVAGSVIRLYGVN